MDQPLVSIVMPCYRQGRYLTASINSALGQSYPHVEVIAVDDGSDDDTEQVVRAFGDKVTYLKRANGGPAAARNTGIAVARGRYLLFLDADDLLDRDAVRCLVEMAGGREDVLCAVGVRDFERDDDLATGRTVFPPEAGAGRKLLEDNFNPPIAFLSSRSMVAAVGGFDPSKSIDACEDWELWVRLVFAGATVVTRRQVGGYYRQHPTSHSRNKLRMARSRSEVMRRTLRLAAADPARVRGLGADPAQLARTLGRTIARECLDAAYCAREGGQYLTALRLYWRGLAGRGRPVEAVVGMCKLIPHRLLRGRRAAA